MVETYHNPHLNIHDRLLVYQLMFDANTSFHSLVEAIGRAGKAFNTLFQRDRILELQQLTQELQGEINHYFLEKVHLAEMADWNLYGVVRAKREDAHRVKVAPPVPLSKPKLR